MINRRRFLGAVGVLALFTGGTAASTWWVRGNARKDPFLIESQRGQFMYVDGVVTVVDRVR